MKKLHFIYDMRIEYSIEVSNCNFTIKCIPKDTLRQKISNLKITMNPETNYQWGKDGFSNLQIWGVNRKPHSLFQFHIEGEAETGLADYEENIDENIAMVFSHSHGLNVAGDVIKQFYEEKILKIESCTFDKALNISKSLFENFRYETGSTNFNTLAEEAFSQGCGVCQDYAHILIALLHLSGITARYVTGFIIGEGVSHAWVEFLDGDKWYGIDPTNNKLVNDEYIKIGHGRDAKDCMINRGIMHGGGLHTQIIKANVQEI
jgi:transglutaminase-like putative cysteine protease